MRRSDDAAYANADATAKSITEEAIKMIAKRRSTFVALFASATLLMCMISTDMVAQSTASILGTVTDSSGASLPDAQIVVRNTGTSATQSVVTDAQGRYRVANLPVGTYDIQSEKPGFQRVARKSIELTVGTDFVLDFSLPVGELAQTVTVQAQVQNVETTSSAISHLVEQSQIRDLPLNGRNFEQLIVLAPGVITFNAVTKNAFYGRGDAFAVNGSRPNGQQMLLDNTDIQDFENRGSGAGVLGTSMGVDAIAEFETLTNTYGAQYGGNGAVVNAVSKSGTNALHGSAYEFLRNSALDARSFFETRVNPGETAAHPAPFKRNQFGGTLGGPIKKDKLFFFVNYEGLRQSLGVATNYTVLDALGRQGYLPVAGSSTYRCLGSANGNSVPGQGNSSPGPCVLPNAAVVPVENFLNQHVELPTSEILTSSGLPTGTGNLVVNASRPGTENYVLSRVDATVSSKDSFYGRYLLDFASVTDPVSGAYNLWPDIEQTRNEFFTIEERHVYSNTLIGSTRFAFMRPLLDVHVPTSYPEFDFYPGLGLPNGRILVSGLTTPISGTARQMPITFRYNKFNVGEDLFWSKGPHTLKFGASVTRNQIGAIQNAPPSGEWTFNSPALFLQGKADRYNGVTTSLALANGQVITGTDGLRDWRDLHYVAYVQEDWKVLPRLTLNVGLRWEPTSNAYEAHEKMTAVVPVPMFSGSVSCSPPNTPTCSAFGTALATGVSPVHNVFAKNPSWRNLDPRIGFAWAPSKDGKTSIRGGYGIFHAIVEARDYELNYTLMPPFSTITARGPNNVINTLDYSTLAPVSTSNVAFTQSGGINRSAPRTPYIQQWNLTLQREVMRNTIASISYVGSHGLHLIQFRDMNPPIPRSNPNFNYGIDFSNPNLVDPYLGYVQQADFTSWSQYNSFQASLLRRLTGNWQMQVSYTKALSRDLNSGTFGFDRGGTADNPYNPETDKGRSSFDIQHNLILNTLYQLPFKGNRLLEGWQVSGILNFHTGFPVNVTDGIVRAFDNAGSNSNRPNYVPDAPGCNGDPVLPQALRFRAGSNPQWINLACFQLERAGELGNTPRNFVNGPGFFDLDASLLKTTKIKEQFTIQFRAEFFNALNHTNFDLPAGNMGFNAATGSANAIAGTISNTVGTARQIQFGLKLMF